MIDWKLWLAVAQWLSTIALAIYTLFSNRHAARQAELQLLATRVTVLEQRSAHQPSAELWMEMHGDLKAMTEALEATNLRMQAMERTMDRINDYLLNHKT